MGGPTCGDGEVGRHVAGDEAAVGHVRLHGFLHFAHTQLVPAIPDPCNVGAA